MMEFSSGIKEHLEAEIKSWRHLVYGDNVAVAIIYAGLTIANAIDRHKDATLAVRKPTDERS